MNNDNWPEPLDFKMLNSDGTKIPSNLLISKDDENIQPIDPKYIRWRKPPKEE